MEYLRFDRIALGADGSDGLELCLHELKFFKIETIEDNEQIVVVNFLRAL